MLETRIVTGIEPCALTAARVARELRALLASGARLRPAGEARRDPAVLFARGYLPRYRLRLFEVTFYLAALRQEANARYFISYVRLGASRTVFPRYFYKDASLIWRSASHFARSDTENWIGKGDLKQARGPDGSRGWYSAEETTNLPLEIQGALDGLARRTLHIRSDERAIELVLRRAPDDRTAPYSDFVRPRRRAAADPTNLVNGGEPVAWFTRRADPASLRFARGFAPDLPGGLLETTASTSRLCGGVVRKHRVLSANRRIQWGFVSSPSQVWLIPPQALTTELSSFGVRTIDVEADDDLFVPGWEYHYIDDSLDPPALYSQIPPGYAGEISRVDPARADASPWLEELPVVRAFRKALGLPRRKVAPSRARRVRLRVGGRPRAARAAR
jgi:hypothetical protein